MEIFSILAIIAMGTLALAYVLMVIAGFQVSLLWGFLNLFLSPLSFIPFIFMHWNKAKYSVFTALIAIVVFSVSMVVQNYTQKPEVLGGEKLGYSLVKPASWKEIKGNFDNADLQFSRSTQDAYIAVFSRKNMPTSLSEFSISSAEKIISQLDQGVLSDCTDVVMGGIKTCEVEMEGCSNDECYSYLLASLNKDGHTVTLLGWTLQSKKDRHFKKLRDIRNSFKWEK